MPVTVGCYFGQSTVERAESSNTDFPEARSTRVPDTSVASLEQSPRGLHEDPRRHEIVPKAASRLKCDWKIWPDLGVVCSHLQELSSRCYLVC